MNDKTDKEEKQEERQITYYSPSQLDMFETCGERYKWRYLLGIKMPPGFAMVRGKGVDKSVTFNLQYKIDNDTLAPKDVVQDVARDEVVKSFQEEVKLEEDYKDLGLTKARNVAADQAVKLAGYHHEHLAPIIQPKAVQKELTAGFSTGKPYLKGYADIIEKDLTIRDTKTSSRAKSQDDIDNSAQLTAYDYMVTQSERKRPKELVLDTLIINAKDEVRHQTLTSAPRTQPQFESYFARLDVMDKSIRAGLFAPAPKDSWQCSAKWCGYFGICKYAKR